MFADAKNGRTEPVQQFEAAHSMMRMLENPFNFRAELQRLVRCADDGRALTGFWCCRFTTSEATVPLFGVHMPTPEEPFVDRLRVALDAIFVFANPCTLFAD